MSVASRHLMFVERRMFSSSASSLALPEKIIYNADESSGVSRVTFSDGSFDYVNNSSAKARPTVSSDTSVYQFPAFRRHNRTRGHGHRKGSRFSKGNGASGDVISVSDGNGADAIDGGADGVRFRLDQSTVIRSVFFLPF